VDRDEFLATFALSKLSQRFTDVLLSIGSSKTQFLVYQFQPVLKFVQSNPRGMLIADEVGLGKTIEAALILRELMARGSADRVLVVCPANLRAKWKAELHERFGLEFRDFRRQDFEEMAERAAQGVLSLPRFPGHFTFRDHAASVVGTGLLS
jgi:SNF2 family DNA or RNA helicase